MNIPHSCPNLPAQDSSFLGHGIRSVFLWTSSTASGSRSRKSGVQPKMLGIHRVYPLVN